jgi:hypothetical protein
MDKLVTKSTQKAPVSASTPELDDVTMLNRISSKGRSVIGTEKKDPLVSHFMFSLCKMLDCRYYDVLIIYNVFSIL